MLRILSTKRKTLTETTLKIIRSKQFSLKEMKINNKLSFLNSEKEMRKYFNIIDWERKEIEDLINKDVEKQKKIFMEAQKQQNNIDNKEIYEIYKKFKEDLNKNTEKQSTTNKNNLNHNQYEYINEFSQELHNNHNDVKYYYLNIYIT
jgi:hypothetical protein